MKTILIADDSVFMRSVLRDILAGLYSIIEADSGRQCIEQFERVRPNLVLLDIVMPEGDEAGIEVLKTIMAAHPSAKVVMITAIAREDAVVKECTRLGAKGFILKPFEEAQVRRVVEESLT